jgi:putative methyltransferase (TIGR04325 family)
VDLIGALPGVAGALRLRHERRFAANRSSNLFRGVYGSFDEALASAPPGRPTGYDDPGPASMYAHRLDIVEPRDYPVMFWLQRLLDAGARRVLDLGGHVGVKYYAYGRYLALPPHLRWQVMDVAAVVARGRELAAERDPSRRLEFTERFEDADGADVLLALGSLQYLPWTLADGLVGLRSPPPAVIVNGLPLHATRSFFTLQSIGTSFCPYRIQAEPEFLASLERVGYSVEDRWENPEKSCEIPFHPEESLDRYHGFLLRRRSP